MSAEAWLMLLALALYAWDSALLLAADELVLVERRGGWTPAFGANGWKLGGREPFMPNPLAPWQGLVRIRWGLDEALAPAPRAAPARLPRVGTGPKVAVTVLLLLVFAALPACLFAYPVRAVALPLVAAIYLTCLAALFGIRRERLALGLDPAAFRKLFWECVTCPPFCINAVRKACLAAPSHARLADGIGAGDREAIARQLALRVREQIDAEAEGTERMARLQAFAKSLETGEPS